MKDNMICCTTDLRVQIPALCRVKYATLPHCQDMHITVAYARAINNVSGRETRGSRYYCERGRDTEGITGAYCVPLGGCLRVA